MELQSVEKTPRPNILRALIQLRDSELEAAKHLFVVCGEPADENQFLLAWAKEDQQWLTSFIFLRALIGAMEKQGIKP